MCFLTKKELQIIKVQNDQRSVQFTFQEAQKAWAGEWVEDYLGHNRAWGVELGGALMDWYMLEARTHPNSEGLNFIVIDPPVKIIIFEKGFIHHIIYQILCEKRNKRLYLTVAVHTITLIRDIGL